MKESEIGEYAERKKERESKREIERKRERERERESNFVHDWLQIEQYIIFDPYISLSLSLSFSLSLLLSLSPFGYPCSATRGAFWNMICPKIAREPKKSETDIENGDRFSKEREREKRERERERNCRPSFWCVVGRRGVVVGM
jgi:hypothetical protein